MANTLLVEEIIERLEVISLRPTSWVANLDQALGFLHGLQMACSIAGLKCGYDDVYRDVAIERGWIWLVASGALPSMKEKGLSDLEIIKELLSIEIEAWKRRYR